MDIERAVFKEMVFKDMIEEAERIFPVKELMQLVKHYTEELLQLHWDDFIRSEPIDPGCKKEILSRLDALRRVIGSERFKLAFHVGCFDFDEEPCTTFSCSAVMLNGGRRTAKENLTETGSCKTKQ
jgi:hypothetical protein